MRQLNRISLILLMLTLLACGPDVPSSQGPRIAAQEIDWDTLIPLDWQPETLLEGFDLDEIEQLDDDDPRAIALMEQLLRLWAEAPVVDELDGLMIRLPGFIVPLDLAAGRMSEFLLVPYYGACIHVPPPPANQTIHVVLPAGQVYIGDLFDAVWVTGTLRVVRSSSELAEAGYQIDVVEIEPYLGEIEPL
ncbi:hypothetical protein CKO25_17335 [Thiocapsa imhoffii]|uniref:DUF3299 domain-containing protein n=1 Tax=Thiocapsa imhoffii TaxID=382777 RepID=A0A9X0WKW6_9GAMM|nr:DUF3299 domain-containing protein [Thiocapsa imhoffii]MBK1646375.1 hypothetical protein [Thiocapsa imhoffii]